MQIKTAVTGLCGADTLLPMSDVFKKYLSAGGVTLFAKLFAMVGTFAEIYFLNILLGKEGYGEFFYAFTIIMVIGIVIGGPMRSLILYRLSNTKDILKSGFMRSAFGLSIVFGGIAFAIVTMIGWRTWIIALASLAAFEMLRVTLCAGLQAMQRIPTMTFFNTLIPYAFRIIMLCALTALGWNEVTDIAGGYMIAFALPVFIIAARYKILPSLSLKPFLSSDFSYGAKTILTQLVHQNARYVDVIVIGSIGMMAATAEYGVALKFATVLLLGKQMVAGLITPRMTHRDITHEYTIARFFEMSVALGGIIGFAVIGSYLLPFFGDYVAVETLFFLVAASMIPKVMTGCSAEFLYMKGHAGWVLVTSVITLMITVSAALYLVPKYGATGSGLTAFISGFTASFILAYAAYQSEKFHVMNKIDAITGFIMIALCLPVGLGVISILYGGVAMAGIYTAYLILNRKYFYQILELARIR